MASANVSVGCKEGTSECEAIKFSGKASYNFIKNCLRFCLSSGANIEFWRIKFRVAWEVVGILHRLVIVQTITEHLQSGMGFACNAESEFIFVVNKNLNWHAIDQPT